jgi:hypothetical protein
MCLPGASAGEPTPAARVRLGAARNDSEYLVANRGAAGRMRNQ